MGNGLLELALAQERCPKVVVAQVDVQLGQAAVGMLECLRQRLASSCPKVVFVQVDVGRRGREVGQNLFRSTGGDFAHGRARGHGHSL